MSSKANNINRGNYEEYFILYMDNELSADERVMVEEFLSSNPDLQAELEVLMSTKLPADEISCTNKNELLAEHMKMQAADNQLLLYIDDELKADEKFLWEKHLQSSPELQHEYAILLQTKLDPAEQVFYPNKNELYRSAKKVAILRPVMSAAAILCLILSAAVLLLNNDSPPEQAVVQHTPKKPAKPHQKITGTGLPATAVGQVEPQKTSKKIKTPEQKKSVAAVNTVEKQNESEPLKREIEVQPLYTKRETAVALNIPASEIINSLPVTTAPAASYNNHESAFEPVTESGENNGKGKAIRGLLRKATRLIERNTGIAAANDDNQILIGAIAVKLK